MTSLKLPVGFILLLFSLGCGLTFDRPAFIEKIDLMKYSSRSQHAPAAVGDRLVLLAGPHGLERVMRKGTSYLIGTVKNSHGTHIADTITDENIGEWIVEALAAELKLRAVLVQRVTKFPEEFDQGVSVRVSRVWVDQAPGFWTVGAISDVSFILEIFSGGKLMRRILVEGKGDSGAMVGTAAQRKESLSNALGAAMDQAVPQIMSTLK